MPKNIHANFGIMKPSCCPKNDTPKAEMKNGTEVCSFIFTELILKFCFLTFVLFQVTQEKKWLSLYKEIFGDAAHKVQTGHGLKRYFIK